MADAKRNEDFLRNIYAKGPFEGHAFACSASNTEIFNLPQGDYTLSDRPVEEWVPWVVEGYERQMKMLEEVGDDSVPVARLITGTHIYATAFGSPPKLFEDSNPCALPFVTTAEEADAIEVPDIWKTRELSRVFELGHAVQKELGEDVYLAPCDVQSGFDTACLVWDKTELYCALADPALQPAVERLAGKCARLLRTFLGELRREFPRMSWCHYPPAWSPPEMGPWLSNDECGAISTAAFEEFQLPELIDLSERFGGLGMHCCATARHQFESFRQIPNFYAFNRVPAGDGWDPLLEHLDGPDAPVHVLTGVSEADTKRLIEESTEGTRFVFVWTGGDVEQAAAWYERMQALAS